MAPVLLRRQRRRFLFFRLGGLEPRPRGVGVGLRRGQERGADGVELVAVAADAPLADVPCICF